MESKALLESWSSINELRKHYHPGTAAVISAYLKEFIPRVHNFASIGIQWEQLERRTLLQLHCPLFFSTRCPTTGADQACILHVGISFPLDFPQSLPQCFLLLGSKHKGTRVRKGSPVFEEDGNIHLTALPMLAESIPPYSICEILIAITDCCEGNSPLEEDTPSEEELPPETGAHEKHSLRMDTHQRRDLLRRAATEIFKQQYQQAFEYLSTRERSLQCHTALNTSAAALRTAEDGLDAKKSVLLEVTPSREGLHQIIASLADRPNNLEAHSSCLISEDDLQDKALGYLAEIHAADDCIKLLEKSLKAGQLNCEQYIKCVSEVAHQQFLARFHFEKVSEEVHRRGAGHLSTAASPTVPPSPPRPSASAPDDLSKDSIATEGAMDVVAMLLQEFPQVDIATVNAVLAFSEQDVALARTQLTAMTT